MTRTGNDLLKVTLLCAPLIVGALGAPAGGSAASRSSEIAARSFPRWGAEGGGSTGSSGSAVAQLRGRTSSSAGAPGGGSTGSSGAVAVAASGSSSWWCGLIALLLAIEGTWILVCKWNVSDSICAME
jgi:hypothetical protein